MQDSANLSHLELQRAGAKEGWGGPRSTPLLPGPPRATYHGEKENVLFLFSCLFFPAAAVPTHCLAASQGSCGFSGLWKETAGDRDKGNRARVARALMSQARWHSSPQPAVALGQAFRSHADPCLDPGLPVPQLRFSYPSRGADATNP